MQSSLVRTTVQIDPHLFKQVKVKMAEDNLTFRDIVHTGLIAVVEGTIPQPKKTKRQKKVRFGGYHLGGFTGSLRREDMYEDYLNDKLKNSSV